MTFEEALKVVDDNKYLIGKRFRGAKIDEFLIVPKDSEQRKNFTRMYIDSLDAETSIDPFIEYDMEVLVVCDKYRIRQENIFLAMTISDLLNMSNEIL